MKHESSSDTESFAIPAQALRGSRRDMLATIDQAIMGLLALRHLVAGDSLVVPSLDGFRATRTQEPGVARMLADVGRVFSTVMRGRD
jgi:hypothetical protein